MKLGNSYTIPVGSYIKKIGLNFTSNTQSGIIQIDLYEYPKPSSPFATLLAYQQFPISVGFKNYTFVTPATSRGTIISVLEFKNTTNTNLNFKMWGIDTGAGSVKVFGASQNPPPNTINLNSYSTVSTLDFTQITYSNVQPTGISLTPSSGLTGSTVTVNGLGFGAGNTTNIYYDGNQVAHVTHSGTSFTQTFLVPISSNGAHVVRATDTTGSPPNNATATFTVTGKGTASISINPSSGTSYTSILISGQKFNANSTLDFFFNGNALNTFPAHPSTNSLGVFSNVQMNIPASFIGYNSVEACDASNSCAFAFFKLTGANIVNTITGTQLNNDATITPVLTSDTPLAATSQSLYFSNQTLIQTITYPSSIFVDKNKPTSLASFDPVTINTSTQFYENVTSTDGYNRYVTKSQSIDFDPIVTSQNQVTTTNSTIRKDTITSTSGSFNSGSTTDETLSITVASNSNRVLIVPITVQALSGTPTINTVKIGSTSFTLAIANDDFTNGQKSEMWYLINPPTGSNTITVNFGAANARFSIGAYSLFNVDQSSPIGATATSSNTAGNAPSSINITPTHTGSWIMDSASILNGVAQGNPVPNKTLGFVENIVGLGRIFGASQYDPNPMIGSSNTLSWTENAFFDTAAIEIKSSNTTTVTSTSSNPNIIGNQITTQPTGSKTYGNLTLSQVNTATAPFKFLRTDVNSTYIKLNIFYPSTFNSTCTLSYNLAFTNHTYHNLPSSGALFQFYGTNTDVIHINCLDENTKAVGSYTLTQNQSSFPLVQQIKDFRAGKFGTSGQFGAFDLLSLIGIILSIIGFNRVNESVGVVFNVALIGVLSFFGILQWQVILSSSIALVLVLVISSTRKSQAF
jgi:hypothetical protein